MVSSSLLRFACLLWLLDDASIGFHTASGAAMGKRSSNASSSSCDSSVKAEAYVKSLVATDYNREVFAGEGAEGESGPIVVYLETSIQQLADLSAASGDLEIELFFTEVCLLWFERS